MKVVDAVTQKNAAAAHEFAATAEELSAQAARLEELVGQFRLGGEAEDGVAAPEGLSASLSVAEAVHERARRLTQRLGAIIEP